jgi:hypothetical protein
MKAKTKKRFAKIPLKNGKRSHPKVFFLMVSMIIHNEKEIKFKTEMRAIFLPLVFLAKEKQ